MAELFRIAGVQMDVTLGDKAANLDRIEAFVEQTTKETARLTIFPECAVTGYCFRDLNEAMPHAETIPGPTIERLTRVSKRHQQFIVTGMLEREGDRLFNACVLVGPEGLIASYRKIHLPFLGVDQVTTPGDRPFAVANAGPVRVGLSICYDGAFPEPARIMALQGADLVILPTNWPPRSECAALYLSNARAMENTIYYAAVDRVGEERGVAFIGHSRICAPNGTTLAAADHQDEAVLYADIDVDLARNKRLVRTLGENEVNRIADRRPEMYGLLAAPRDPSLRTSRETGMEAQKETRR
jgi:predicted amidohydrolase